MQHLSEKNAISGFPVSPGSAEALVRCGGKIKYILIAYFLRNIYAKNCRNRTVYAKIIASCKGGTFFETQCRMHTKVPLWDFAGPVLLHASYVRMPTLCSRAAVGV